MCVVCCLIAATVNWVACSDEKKPDGLVPELTVYAAKDITRNSAVLSGRIVVVDRVEVTSCSFVCSSSVNDGQQPVRVTVTRQGELVEAVLDGLQAGHTYSYYLEAGNNLSKVASERMDFTTLPNVKPVLTDMELVGKGPISATVRCSLLDDGGLSAKVGFRVQEKSTGAVQELTSERLTDGSFAGKFDALSQESSFTVYAFAVNEVGETRSKELAFETSNTVLVTIPGTLKEQLEGEMRYQLNSLTVAGKLNGSDIRLLRDLLGRGFDEESTPGKMKRLDLYDAEIVAGGANYAESRYTVDNTLGTGMFKDCLYLEELVLPSTTEVVEKDAMAGCVALKALHLPLSVVGFTPSGGCTALQAVTVSSLNTQFSSGDGVLYDKSGSKLLFYPEGRTATLFVIPSTVRTIGEYAFRNAPALRVEIPRTVESLSAHSFYASRVEEVTLEGITTIPYAAFQSCANLRKVTLGPSTTLLSDYCFDGCPLRDIYVEADYPPVCRSTAFAPASVYQEAVVHVLPGCKNLYRLSNSWKTFLQFVEDVVPDD